MLGFCNITDHEHTSEIRVLSLMKCSCETRFKMIPSLLFYIIFPQWGEGRYSLRKEYIKHEKKNQQYYTYLCRFSYSKSIVNL